MNVLITGVSSGMGYVTAKYLKEKGVYIVGIDVNEPKEKNFDLFFKADIREETSLKEIYLNLHEKKIVFDAIINFAGIFLIDSFIEADFSAIKRIFDINLLGTILVNKTFFSLLREKGKILITTSEVAPLTPLPFNGIYHATKTALDSYATALREELNLIGYQVVVLRPGAFDTNITAHTLEKTNDLVDRTVIYKPYVKNFYKIVSRFMGTPKNPLIIAKKVFHILGKKKPRYTYSINRNIGLILLSMLPKRTQCLIVKGLLTNKK